MGWTLAPLGVEMLLAPLGVTQHRLAGEIGLPRYPLMYEIVHGKRRVTADTALRLARFLRTTDRSWLTVQTRYDLTSGLNNVVRVWEPRAKRVVANSPFTTNALRFGGDLVVSDLGTQTARVLRQAANGTQTVITSGRNLVVPKGMAATDTSCGWRPRHRVEGS